MRICDGDAVGPYGLVHRQLDAALRPAGEQDPAVSPVPSTVATQARTLPPSDRSKETVNARTRSARDVVGLHYSGTRSSLCTITRTLCRTRASMTISPPWATTTARLVIFAGNRERYLVAVR